MSKRLLDHLLAEDVLQLREGLRRAEDVEARVEAASVEPSPLADLDEPDAQPTIAATRQANRAGRGRRGAVVALAAVALLAAGGAYLLLNYPDSGEQAPVSRPRDTRAAPVAATAPAPTTAAAPATMAADSTTTPSATTVETSPASAAPQKEKAAAPTQDEAPAPAAKPAPGPKQAPEAPPAPAAPTEEFWVVAGPFASEEAAGGVKTYAPDLTIRKDSRNVKLSAQMVRSESPTSEADARNLANQLAAYGIAASLEADDGGYRLNVGPLASPSAAEQAATLLLSLGHPAKASRVQVDSAVIYVDIGPLPTEEEASALSRTIQERLSVRTGLKREAAAP